MSSVQPPVQSPINNVPRDSHLRSLLKAFSWRIVATLTTSIIAYFVTGQIDTALMIGGIEFTVKFLIYYFHERAWALLPDKGASL